MSSSIMLVNEILSERQEFARALEAEGFNVVEAASADEAIRAVWEGSFLVVFIASVLTGTNPTQLSTQLQQMAPEVETVVYGKSDHRGRLVRKAIDIRDGVAA